MASQDYDKTVSEDFLNGIVNVDRLTQDIQNSSITIALDYELGIAVEGDNCKIWFKETLPSEDQTALTDVCAAHTGEPLPDPVTADGRPIVALAHNEQEGNAILVSPRPAIGEDLDVFSHNFCDPTTWWQNAKKEVDETLTTSDNLTYATIRTNLLNIYSGKVTDEAKLWPEYVPVVKVDGVEKTMRSPFSATGGDYVVNNVPGTITFFNTQSGTVTMTYYWVDTSVEECSAWDIVAPSGKAIYIKGGKVNLSSDDWEMTTHFLYKIIIGGQVVGSSRYDTAEQLLDVAGECLSDLPASVGGATRGTSGPRRSYKIRYETTRNLYGEPAVPGGMTLRLRLGGDTPFGGSRFTANLSGLIQDL